ncbi:MAG: HNH endonuclease [Alphaproteobacteria bacterium]|nr:HNH endonuclease [Alphaproteobacteria bacterium]
MANAIFVHKAGSPYDDSESHYHFPKIYLGRVNATVGDRIVYYGNCEGVSGRYYKAVAKVDRVRADPNKADHYYADMSEHLEFDSPVDYLSNGGYEAGMIKPDGKPNGGLTVNAVRLITPGEFARIVEAGFHDDKKWPERDRQPETLPSAAEYAFGLAEDAPLFIQRPVVSSLVDRKFRDRRFRQHVLDAYDRRCAFTGLRIINGGGRPEVEAAHIIPVELNGSDSVRNGIALSGTAHWMFDAGLLTLTDDFTILKSRHLNYDIDHLLNKDAKAILPKSKARWPNPANLKWHRDNKFKI